MKNQKLTKELASTLKSIGIWNYSTMPNTIYSFLLSISWAVWTFQLIEINFQFVEKRRT